MFGRPLPLGRDEREGEDAERGAYDAADPDLAAERERARDLTARYNRTAAGDDEDVPAGVVVGGNPATVVRELDGGE